MGACGSTGDTNSPRQEKKPMGYNRNVTIHQDEVVVAKLKVQRDRLESRIKKLDRDEVEFRNKALNLAKSGKREEAVYACRQKKRCKEYRKKAYQRMDFIDRQIHNVETAQDDVAFTKTLAESNKALQKLHDEIDMEEIRMAKELQEEGRMRREELDQLLEDDDDDIKAELDRIEAQVLGEGFEGVNVDAGRNQQRDQQGQQGRAGQVNQRRLQMV